MFKGGLQYILLFHFIASHEDHCLVLWAIGLFPFDVFGWAKPANSQDTKTRPTGHLRAQLLAWRCSSSLRRLLLFASSPVVRVAATCRRGGKDRWPEGGCTLRTGFSLPPPTAAARTAGARRRRFASEHGLLPLMEEATARVFSTGREIPKFPKSPVYQLGSVFCWYRPKFSVFWNCAR